MINKTNNKKYIFSFIGSGISSMFLLNEFLKNKELSNESLFHIYEKSIFPFGLVRNGFAPDNYKTKENLTKLFIKNLKQNNNVKYFGNVFINNDNLKKISPNYSLIFSGNGIQKKRLLNIPNENLMFEAIDLAKWYNGDIVEDKNLKYAITNNKINNLIIIGNGNVSLDIIRILFLIKYDLLYKYGVPEDRIKYIKKLRNKINKIYIIGRNSIDNPSFTKFEFKNFLRHCINCGNINIKINDMKIINKNNFYISKKINFYHNSINTNNNDENNSYKKKDIIFLFNNTPIKYDGKYLYLKNNFDVDKIKSNIIIKSIGRDRQDFTQINNLIQLPIYKNISEGLIYSKNLFEQIMSQINNKLIKKHDIQKLNSCLEELKMKSKIIYKKDLFKIDEYEKSQGVKKGKIRDRITEIQNVFKLL